MNPQPYGRPKGKHRRQILLFGISVLLPALVLLFFTIRMNRQDRELRISRAQDAQIQKAEEIGQHLAVRLERAEQSLLQELTAEPSGIKNIPPSYPGLVFLGLIREGELKMPWEENREQSPAEKGDPSQNLIRQAQQAEFSQKNPGRARTLYNRALMAATSSSKKNFIRLQLGRILIGLDDEKAALQIYTEVLAQPYDVIDEYGNPFCLFAGERLLTVNGYEEMVMKRLEGLLKEKILFPPGALYLIRDIGEQLRTKKNLSGHMDRIQNLEQTADNRLEDVRKLLSLKPFVTGWISRRQSGPEITDSGFWQAYGETPWIVAIRGFAEYEAKFLFIFHGPKILNAVIEENGLTDTFPGYCSMSTDRQAGRFPLGNQFHDLQLQFTETGVSAWSHSSLPLPVFYWLILFLVMGFTGFGMYLLWRDFRRELALADMRSQFAASVSHELKTPLTAIRMYAEALTLGVRKKPEAQKDYLFTIINESERLSRLLNNVLDFSKIEQGTRTYSFEPTSLAEVVEAAKKAITFPTQQKGFNLEVEIEKDIPAVPADKDALVQAVLNLLQNAIKYSGDSREVKLKLYQNGHEVFIDVKDFGIGISEEDKSQIFSRFFRGPNSENQRIPGTGLGLTIVSHIAKAHNGRIEVTSQPGKGSTFSIIFPLEQK